MESTQNIKHKVEGRGRQLILDSKEGNTSFIYQVKGDSELSFVKVESDILNNNLKMVDTALPLIIAEMLRVSYTQEIVKINEIVKIVSTQNKLQFDYSYGHNFYSHKVKRLLYDCVFGLLPNIPWRGIYNFERYQSFNTAIDVSDLAKFEEYLFSNSILSDFTKIDTNEFFVEDGNAYLKLYLGIVLNSST